MFKLKKFLFLFPILAMTLFAFTACGGDDDDNDENEGLVNINSALVGTWLYEEEDMETEVLTFKSNGTGTWVWYDPEDNSHTELAFKWTATEKKFTMTYSGISETIPYTISGNILILHGEYEYIRQ